MGGILLVDAIGDIEDKTARALKDSIQPILDKNNLLLKNTKSSVTIY